MKKFLPLLALLALSQLAFLHRQAPLLEMPGHFPEPTYNFSRNPLAEDRIELGRALFYDPILSRDSSISCASCHSPYNAFAHTDHDLSHGIEGRIGTRNAPPLFNLAWTNIFMWDGAVNHLDVQALAPISHPDEMGEDIAHVVQKLDRHDKYPLAFEAAFGDPEITGERVLKALSQFQLTLVSASAKYDSVRNGTAQFTAQETSGYALFQQHCGQCHTEPLFTNGGFANNGLPVDTTLNDRGRATVTQKASDEGLFKVPSLRNLAFSYPYMHDGRFKRLHEVLEHYASGIEASPTLSPHLQQPILLSDREKTDLIAFLRTLNDRSFVFAPDHQFPRFFFQ